MNAVMTKRFIGSLSLQSLAEVALDVLKVFVLGRVVVEQGVVNENEPIFRSHRSFSARCRVVPAADIGSNRIGLMRPPSSGLVLEDRRNVTKNWIHDAPGGLDRIFAVEERCIAAHGIAQQAFVGRHLIARVLVRYQLDVLARHSLAGCFDARTERDDKIRAETKPIVIGMRVNDLLEDPVRRAFQRDPDLCGG